MGDFDFNPSEIIKSSDRFLPTIRKREPVIDREISKAIGKNVLVNDHRLINLIVKWKKQKGDDESPDNFLKDPKKVEELRKTFTI